MSNEKGERLQAELALIEAMYPGQIAFNGKAGEVKYSSSEGSFTLRLPAGYLDDRLPEVLSASSGRVDLREQMRHHLQSCIPGEEVLDYVISAFKELSDSQSTSETVDRVENGKSQAVNGGNSSRATIVVWLHHLLNTNKRKQSLSPPSPDVSGVTKPGYPGVLIFSGPAKDVHEHVNELKQLNWQAFQVRLESVEHWSFSHGTGVKEVETMVSALMDISYIEYWTLADCSTLVYVEGSSC